jgi:ubiquinone/menaquinone biosynthesis C-methylase UbiE
MSDLEKRLQGMTPEKRELLKKMLEQKGIAVPAEPVLPPVEAARDEEAMSNVLKKVADTGSFEGRTVQEYLDKDLIRSVYNAYHTQLRSAVFHDESFFMNLGYVANALPQYARVQLPERMVGRHYFKLVLETIGDADIADKRVLDVGCGRGGTIHTIQKWFKPRTVTGIDITSGAIEFSRVRHAAPNARFMLGDAEKLPFDAASFDVVTNLESSHHYANIDDFYAGVWKVLSPGGHFCYTTMLSVERFEEDRRKLARLGFDLLRDTDITPNVLLACDQDRNSIFGDLGSAQDNQWIANAISLPGSETYNMMAEGKTQYRVMKLRKPTGV